MGVETKPMACQTLDYRWRMARYLKAIGWRAAPRELGKAFGWRAWRIAGEWRMGRLMVAPTALRRAPVRPMAWSMAVSTARRMAPERRLASQTATPMWMAPEKMTANPKVAPMASETYHRRAALTARRMAVG